MAKTAIEGAQRANLFMVDPDDILLSVIDCPCGAEDPYYEPRNKMPINESLVQSAMRVGIRTPIEVVKNAAGDLLPVFGNQRVRAAREANRRFKEAGKKDRVLVPCKSPTKGADAAELAEVSTAENECRQESPALIKAEQAAKLLRHNGGDEAAAAKVFGVSLTHFRSLLTLRESSGELKAALKANKLSASAAMVVASLPPEKQAERVEAIVAAGGSVEIAKTAVRAERGTTDKSKPTTPLLRDLLECYGTDAPLWKAINPRDVMRWVVGELSAKDIPALKSAIEAAQ